MRIKFRFSAFLAVLLLSGGRLVAAQSTPSALGLEVISPVNAYRLAIIANSAVSNEGVYAPGAVLFSPDATTLVYSRQNGILLWDVLTHTVRASIEDNCNSSSEITFGKDGTRLLIGSNDGTVCIWDLSTRAQKQLAAIENAPIAIVAESSEGKFVAIIDKQTQVWTFDVQKGTARQLSITGDQSHRPLAFSPSGQLLVASDSNKVMRLWDMETGEEHAFLPAQRFLPRRVVFSPDGNYLALEYNGGLVRIASVSTGLQQQVLQGIGTENVVFSPDGKLIAAMGLDARTIHEDKIIVWDFVTGKQLAYLSFDVTIGALAFNADGTKLLAADNSGGIIELGIAA